MGVSIERFRSWILPACIGGFLSAVLAFQPPGARAQKTSSTTTTTGPLTPNSSLPTGFQPTPQFVNGKVVMDDGTLVPDGVPIELVCSGIARTEGHSDPKGAFGIELGHTELTQDASANNGAILNPNRPPAQGDIAGDPNRPYRECELRANVPGYRSDAILLANYRPGENSNVGTIVLHRMGNVEGSVISATTAAAPRPAAKEYERGLDAVKKGKVDDAVDAFNRAVSAYPEFAAAWFELGKLQSGRQQLLDAQKSFESAIKAEPKFISPYLPLSELVFKARNWPAVVDITDRLLKLDAFDFPQEFYYNGLANYTLQRMEPAEKSLREAIKLDSQNRFPKAHQFLAAVLVKKDELSGAAEELGRYLELSPGAQDAEPVRKQLAQLQRVAGGGGAGK